MNDIIKKTMMSMAIVLAFSIGVLVDYILYVPPIPKISEKWWGSGNMTDIQEDTRIERFQLNISQSVLDDLKHRVQTARRTVPLENSQQHYGINADVVFNAAEYLITTYNWTKRQENLNKLPQYITTIQGLRIHYIHIRPPAKESPTGKSVKVLPLLMLHGFPSSMIEFLQIIPELTRVEHLDEEFDFVFELVIPNMPGFGLSQGTSKSGLGCAEVAVVMRNLMHRIGFSRYYIFGTDWGSVIADNIGILYPTDVLGIYSPMCVSFRLKSVLKFFMWELYPYRRNVSRRGHKRPYASIVPVLMSDTMKELGYVHEFVSNRPDTVGISLNDSPIGLLAQMINLFTKGTDCEFISLDDAGISNLELDIILDNFMLYWTGAQIYSSARLYAECMSTEGFFKLSLIPVNPNIPVSCPQLPGEIMSFPDWILKDKYPNLIRSTVFADGGHFYNYEKITRNEMAADIFSSVAEMRLQRI